jgi:hypothetical protein
MEHHADFAIPVSHRLVIETDYDRPAGGGKVAGRAIALGWWVDQPGSPPSTEPPTGVLYLVVDPSLPRPVWCAQARVTSTRLDD